MSRRTVSDFTHAAGNEYKVRVQAIGTSPTRLRAKVWPASSPEPASWADEVLDSEADLQTAGGVGFSWYVSSGALAKNYGFGIDDLTVRQAN